MTDVRMRAAGEVGEFFRTLARRLRKETHLSDITYSAIEVIPDFKQDFIHYFFSDLNTDEAIEVRREFALPGKDGQPDLVFSAESWDLIIENKIWDENYHFDQYGKSPLGHRRPIPRVGLIANHHVRGVPESWRFREWTDFVEDFSQRDYGEFQAVFAGYLTYVREICNVAEFEKFTFEPKSLFALTHFVRTAERAIRNSSTDLYELTIKPSHKWSCGESWAGHWFELKSADSKKTLILFFGIDFSYESKMPAITVDVHKGDNPLWFKAIERTALKSQLFQKFVWKEDGYIQLQMPQEAFMFLNDQPKEKQLVALQSFLRACCNALLKNAP